MISFEKGVLKINSESDSVVRHIYDFTFILNMIIIFTMVQVKYVATVSGILMLLSSLLLWVGYRQKTVTIPYNAMWYLAFTAFASLSMIWAENFSANNVGAIIRMLVILAMITSVAIYVENEEHLERLISLFIFSVLIIVFIELAYVPVENWFTSGEIGSFNGNNPNEVTLWVFGAEMFALYKAYSKKQLPYYILVVLFLFFIVLSGSRKSLLIGLAGPIMLVGLTTDKKFYFLKIALIIVLAVGTFQFIMTNENVYNTIGKRFASLFDYWGGDTSSDGSAYYRDHYQYVARQLFRESPVLGKGLGNFVQITSLDYGLYGRYSHHNYWQILSELGIIGLIIYYSLYIKMAFSLIKSVILERNRMSALFLTLLISIMAIEIGIVTLCSKYVHIMLAMIYCSTYVVHEQKRKFKYLKKG